MTWTFDMHSLKAHNLPWGEIHWVLLDMDGTLLDLHFDNFFWLEHVPQAYASKYQISFTEAKEQLFENFDAKRGQIEWYCLDYWSDRLGLPIAELKNNVRHKIALRKNTIQFLQHLRKLNKEIVLFTNAHADSLNLKMQETGLSEHFDHIVSSHEYGVPKESQACWQKLQQQLGFVNSQTLFVDDSQAVLESAKQFGVKWCLGIEHPDALGKAKCAEGFQIIDDFMDLFAKQGDENE